jgi:hypothetical protein
MLSPVIHLYSCVSSSPVIAAVELIVTNSGKPIDVGKGGQVQDLDGDEEDGFDECMRSHKNISCSYI